MIQDVAGSSVEEADEKGNRSTRNRDELREPLKGPVDQPLLSNLYMC